MVRGKSFSTACMSFKKMPWFEAAVYKPVYLMTVKSNHCFVSCCKELTQIHLTDLNILQFTGQTQLQLSEFRLVPILLQPFKVIIQMCDFNRFSCCSFYLCISELQFSKSYANLLWIIGKEFEAVMCKGNTSENMSRYVELIMSDSSSESCLSTICLYDFTGTLSSCE